MASFAPRVRGGVRSQQSQMLGCPQKAVHRMAAPPLIPVTPNRLVECHFPPPPKKENHAHRAMQRMSPLAQGQFTRGGAPWSPQLENRIKAWELWLWREKKTPRARSRTCRVAVPDGKCRCGTGNAAISLAPRLRHPNPGNAPLPRLSPDVLHPTITTYPIFSPLIARCILSFQLAPACFLANYPLSISLVEAIRAGPPVPPMPSLPGRSIEKMPTNSAVCLRNLPSLYKVP